MSKKELMAYLAGAIDSDGTIGIKRSTYSMRVTGDSTAPTFSERVALRQVQKSVPELLQNTFGGSLYISKPSSKRGRPLWSWAVTDMKAVECIRSVLPYLRVKRLQAENCLKLRAIKEKSKKARVAVGRGHVGAAPRPAAITANMESTYIRAKELNKVGI